MESDLQSEAGFGHELLEEEDGSGQALVTVSIPGESPEWERRGWERVLTTRSKIPRSLWFNAVCIRLLGSKTFKFWIFQPVAFIAPMYTVFCASKHYCVISQKKMTKFHKKSSKISKNWVKKSSLIGYWELRIRKTGNIFAFQRTWSSAYWFLLEPHVFGFLIFHFSMQILSSQWTWFE